MTRKRCERLPFSPQLWPRPPGRPALSRRRRRPPARQPPPPYGAPIDRARDPRRPPAPGAENAIASAVAEHKARTAAAFRRPTRAFEEATRGGATVLSLEVVIASAGGVPLVEDGRLIGAIGCSGGANADDETICLAGAATINGSAS